MCFNRKKTNQGWSPEENHYLLPPRSRRPRYFLLWPGLSKHPHTIYRACLCPRVATLAACAKPALFHTRFPWDTSGVSGLLISYRLFLFFPQRRTSSHREFATLALKQRNLDHGSAHANLWSSCGRASREIGSLTIYSGRKRDVQCV